MKSRKTSSWCTDKGLLLLSRFSRVRLCATPQTAAHQAPPSLGFSRQKHWSGLPLPSPMHESGKWKWSRSVVFDPQWPHGLQPTRLLRPWDFPGKSTGVGCHCLFQMTTSQLAVHRNTDHWTFYHLQDCWFWDSMNNNRKIWIYLCGSSSQKKDKLWDS